MRNLSRSAPLTGGGTISGDLTVTGDMVVEGEGALSVDQLLEGDFKISTASATAFVVGDISEPANDIFTVDTDNGRVGIGTASPSEALEIAGGNLIFNSGQEGGASSRDITIQPSNNYADYSIITLGINDYNDETGYIAFSTRRGSPTWATTEAMRIDSSGNVGIGTDEPEADLHVLSGGTTNADGIIFSNGASNEWNLMAGIIGQTSTGMSIFDKTDGAVRFCIDTSGNVGIGTASPGAKLDISGGDMHIDATQKIYLDGGDGSYFSETAANEISMYANNQLTLRIREDSDHMKSEFYGGTFDVNDAGDDQYIMRITGTLNDPTAGTTENFRALKVDLTTTDISGWGGNVYLMDLQDTGTSRMVVQSDGNVGIGDSTPDYKLDVAGTLGVDGNATFGGDVSVPTKTPSSASDTGTTGTITWDASYVYVCTATNTWKRVAIATW